MKHYQAPPPPKYISIKRLIELRLLLDFEVYINDEKQTLAKLCTASAGLFQLVELNEHSVKAKTIDL